MLNLFICLTISFIILINLSLFKKKRYTSMQKSSSSKIFFIKYRYNSKIIKYYLKKKIIKYNSFAMFIHYSLLFFSVYWLFYPILVILLILSFDHEKNCANSISHHNKTNYYVMRYVLDNIFFSSFSLPVSLNFYCPFTNFYGKILFSPSYTSLFFFHKCKN